MFIAFACISSNIEETPKADSTDEIKVYENLSVGMSFDQIIEKLMAESVEYSLYSEEPKIRGIFRDVKTSPMTSKSILFNLYFDHNNNLTKKEVYTQFTGM